MQSPTVHSQLQLFEQTAVESLGQGLGHVRCLCPHRFKFKLLVGPEPQRRLNAPCECFFRSGIFAAPAAVDAFVSEWMVLCVSWEKLRGSGNVEGQEGEWKRGKKGRRQAGRVNEGVECTPGWNAHRAGEIREKTGDWKASGVVRVKWGMG